MPSNVARTGPAEAEGLLLTYRASARALYVVGSLDTNVTILSQQIRALNLAWALTASGALDQARHGRRPRVAVIGGGFAGVTVTAGLVQKGAAADITLFERRDTLLPLQYGSDSRWVHPHIYDWPAIGSEASSAALPILNWTAGRASDVVVKVLREWGNLIARADVHAAPTTLKVFCNTRHLRVDESVGTSFRVEFVGEERQSDAPSIPVGGTLTTHGLSQEFDIIILALGFGLERDHAISYWRNENFGQPVLGEATQTYIVSGQGDGAMIDLLRLRIAQFRQDRILSELFGGTSHLVRELQAMQEKVLADPATDLFGEFDRIWSDGELSSQTQKVTQRLADRLRQDTRVVLHLRDNRFAHLFSQRRISFQNRLLAYMLYRCGGFYPSSVDLDGLASELGVPDKRIVRRHGTDREETLKGPLSDALFQAISTSMGEGSGASSLRQTDHRKWPGGYFGYLGATNTHLVSDAIKAVWRKEYLPGPTQAIAASLCSTVAGYLIASSSTHARLRVTLHRMLLMGDELLLQQCCEYSGINLASESEDVVGRTFPSDQGTIGASFTNRGTLRTRKGARHGEIEIDMQRLNLRAAARGMPGKAASLLAMPILVHPVGKEPATVAVVYADSDETGFFSDSRVAAVRSMCQQFAAEHFADDDTGSGIVNTSFWAYPSARKAPQEVIDVSRLRSLELLKSRPPFVEGLPYFNFDFSDFPRVIPE